MESLVGSQRCSKLRPVPGVPCILYLKHFHTDTEAKVSILDTAIGQELTPLVKPPVTQEQLRRYAEASGDYNPIHLSEEAAHNVGLDSVIAHGMLSMAFLGQFITRQIADMPGARLAHLNVRFMNMVRLGDTLTCHGVVNS